MYNLIMSAEGVHELAECIETHGDALYAVHSVYGQIKDRPEAPIRSVAEKLARCVKKSRELLEKLTQVKGEWGCGDLPGLTRLLRHYEYDQNGGRDQVEKFLSKIEKLQGSIQTLLITANMYVLSWRAAFMVSPLSSSFSGLMLRRAD